MLFVWEMPEGREGGFSNSILARNRGGAESEVQTDVDEIKIIIGTTVDEPGSTSF